MVLALQVGISLDTFWTLSLFEIGCYIEAFNKERKQQYELYAWHAANIMNCWTKKSVKPKDLLGGDNSNSSNGVNLVTANAKQLSAFYNKMESLQKKK